MSKVGEYYRELEEMNPPESMQPEPDAVSNCCTAPFTYPGWPDSDMCSKCYEHADVGEEYD